MYAAKYTSHLGANELDSFIWSDFGEILTEITIFIFSSLKAASWHLTCNIKRLRQTQPILHRVCWYCTLKSGEMSSSIFEISYIYHLRSHVKKLKVRYPCREHLGSKFEMPISRDPSKYRDKTDTISRDQSMHSLQTLCTPQIHVSSPS